MAYLRDLVASQPQPAGRICAGNCEHFEALYEWGRKIAGRGVCDKHDCGAPVRVGMLCRWTETSSRAGAQQPEALALRSA